MKILLAVAVLSLLVNRGVSLAADFDGDGTGDVAVFRAGSGLWAVRGITRVYFGITGDAPVPGDYDGSGRDSAAVFRESSGLWAARGVTRVYFGGASDEPRPGDFDGDRTDDCGIFRSGTGLWAVRGITRIYFGSSGDTALAPGKATGPVQSQLPVTGQTTSYRTGDDGYHQAGAAFDFDQFLIWGAEITIDNNTGLMWASDGDAKGCAFGQQTHWSAAVLWCNNLNFGGKADWRLPNVKELQSIVDHDETYPSIDKAYFPNTASDRYWTSTTRDSLSSRAWVLEFKVAGKFEGWEKASLNYLYLRAVRGPD